MQKAQHHPSTLTDTLHRSAPLTDDESDHGGVSIDASVAHTRPQLNYFGDDKTFSSFDIGNEDIHIEQPHSGDDSLDEDIEQPKEFFPLKAVSPLPTKTSSRKTYGNIGRSNSKLRGTPPAVSQTSPEACE